MAEELPLLRKSFEDISIVKKKTYDYFVHPITDGIPCVEPALLREIVSAMRRRLNLKCDKIVTLEAMGIPIAAALSLDTGMPFVVIRKRRYGLSGEIEEIQKTGYSESKIYINGIMPGERVVLVDDVISTGGTLVSAVEGLRRAGAHVSEILVVIEKGESKADAEKKIDMPITTLIKVAVENGRVVIKK
jgi:adenine phosphoribosyltransferase